MKEEAKWAEIRIEYRRNLRRVLNNINEGTVSEDDLDALNNFCMTAVILMGKVPETVWRKAQRDAEVKAWLIGGICDKWNMIRILELTTCIFIIVGKELKNEWHAAGKGFR